MERELLMGFGTLLTPLPRTTSGHLPSLQIVHDPYDIFVSVVSKKRHVVIIGAGFAGRLRTVEGRLLQLRFSEKSLAPSCDGAAHVDVAGDLPAAAEWRADRDAARPAP
ncbi:MULTISPECIES: hypothetical protein [unclassified Acidiphilium]|uniref:hypothetical protein n=1 Tax=unclassified Acidiphilium TaxID=2617493 RepID=UPI0012DF5E21|nr:MULTISPECIES: hypothetical protein [unclassified Acidiphilium]